jgi:hypothetical protein
MCSQPVYSCRQHRLLIAGSRHASNEMLQIVHQAVARAKANGWMVLVGDNPKGIDAAVIDACDEMDVNVMVFGVTARPRKGSKREGSYWRVDTKFEHDGDFVPGKAYTARDRYMIDLADRCFFMHDGASRGTRAGYDYAMSVNKPADIRVFAVANEPTRNTPPVTAAKSAVPVPHTIELVIDVTECDAPHRFEGVYGLRALDEQGHPLYNAQQIIQAEVNTSDGARMQTIIAGLERLVARLKAETAPYHLRIYQTSKNVDGWLAHNWKRNVPEVQRLTQRIETLLHTFPETEWIKQPRPQVQSRLSKMSKGGDVRQSK